MTITADRTHALVERLFGAALRLDEALAGQTLKVEVEATDRRGRRQLERNAGTIRIAP